MSIVAVGGAKGGAGRSVVAAGIAVFFAQLGKRVLVVDGHPNAPQLATSFGCAPPPMSVAPWADPVVEARGRDTIVPNVRLLSTYGETGTLAGVSLKRPREIAAHSGADHVVIDLGSGSQSALLDAMLDVDAAVLVALPEPSSVEAVYRWIRHAFARSLSHGLKTSPPALAAMRSALDREGAPPAPIDLARIVARAEPSVGPIVWESLHALRPWLVVNASRSRVDLELGDAMTHLSKQRLGVELQFLGHVEYDEAVSLAARKRRPLLVDAPGAKAARNLERLARKLSASLSGVEPGTERTKPMPTEPPPPTHYDTLLVDRGATDEEIRRAVRKMRERYATESLASAGLCSLDDRESALSRIEEARDVLLDPVRRRPYDLSITPPERSAFASASDGAREEPEPVELPPMPELTPESEFSGALLRAVREARGIDLRELSARTKIPLTSLRAIEEEVYESLPPAVYLRGFVAEVARQLKLEPDQVARTYLRRARERGMTN